MRILTTFETIFNDKLLAHFSTKEVVFSISPMLAVQFYANIRYAYIIDLGYHPVVLEVEYH